MKENNFEWWGYLHINGSIQVKRVWLPTYNDDIIEANSSPFVHQVFNKFKAKTREEAN